MGIKKIIYHGKVLYGPFYASNCSYEMNCDTVMRVTLDDVHFLDEEDIVPTLSLKRIIFNPPATIAIFSDGSKSVVKTQGKDKYDPEKGISLAIAKRFLSKKQYHTMLMAADCARVYDLLGIKGEINIDAEKGTLKLIKPRK